MKSFILAVAMIALVAGDLFAQQCGSGQCGSSSGTNQCSINSRPRAAEPAAVPQAAPVSLQSVAVTEEWKAPEADSVFKVASYDRISGDSGNDRVQATPVGFNLGLVNVGNGNRRGDADALIAQTRAEIDQQRSQITRLEQMVIDARARGEEVTFEDVQRAVNAARYQPTPDEAYELMRSSPRFQRDLQELLNTQSPQIVRWEVVPVE